MRAPGRVVTCSACGKLAPHQAKGLCQRCYAKARQRKVVCIDCGRLWLEHRGGRCARCYRRARMTVKTCAVCGGERLAWGPVCRPCLLSARSSGGACGRCGRLVGRLWGGRCTRCAKRHWTTATCRSCLGWSTSIETGRCRACRDFERHNATEAPCRSCRRALSVNRFGRCRLCTVTRRDSHTAGDPTWAEEPGGRGGIQLFFADGDSRRRSRAPIAQAVPPASMYAAGSSRVVQQRLFVSLDPERTPDAGPLGTVPYDLVTAVREFGDARGWTRPTTDGVTEAVLLLAGEGSWSLTEPGVAELRRLRLPASRVREFLIEYGVELADDRAGAWVDRHLDMVAPTMRAEVMAWVQVLDGRGTRRRPRLSGTVRHYVAAAAPVITGWSHTHESLREITAEDVKVAVASLEGSHRVMTAVALRSLFKNLKSQRLIFTDPTMALSPGRFPATPVIGLDAASRSLLLSRLERPDHRLVVLLAGVHALSRGDIMRLRLDDIDLDSRMITVRADRRPLDGLVIDHVVAWLEVRRQRWPRSANPHLLVTQKSAYGLDSVSTSYFKGVFASLPTTAAGLRADRLLGEAVESGGDVLRLVSLFGLSSSAAMRYCTQATDRSDELLENSATSIEGDRSSARIPLQ